MSAIHQAMLAIMADAASIGIGKNSQNKAQNYKYRGIEEAMNTMAGILIKNKVLMLPSYETITEKDLPTQKGGSLEFVKVRGTFTFTSVEDGSSVTTQFFGEGMDSGDKATTKAQSVAYRTALFQTFDIPTVAIDPEADEGNETLVSPEVQEILDAAQQAAEKGTEAYRFFWAGLQNEKRSLILGEHEAFKNIAAMVDQQVPA